MPTVVNKHGQKVRTFIVKQLEEEYWNIIKEVKVLSGKTTNADVLRWALQRVTNRV